MEIAGTVGAAVGLACAVGSVSKALAKFIRTIRLADHDAYQTQMELTAFSYLLNEFHQVVSPHHSQGAMLDGQSDVQTPVITQGKRLITAMERVLDEIGILDSEKLQTGWQRWLSKLRWYARKKDVLALCIQFNQVKLSVMAFVSSVGLKTVLDELSKLRAEIRRLRHNHPSIPSRQIAQLEQRRHHLEDRVAALKLEVEAAQVSCRLAAREVRHQHLPPEARDLSRDLEHSVRRVSRTVIDSTPGQRHRHSSSRRSSRRSPSSHGRSARRPPTSPSPSPTGPSHPPPPPAPAPAPPPPVSVTVDGPEQPEDEEEESAREEGVAPLVTRNPRYFRDFRNEPFPYRPPPGRERPAEGGVDERADSAGTSTGLANGQGVYGQGAYVNPENPQDRRRRLPNGRLSEEQ